MKKVTPLFALIFMLTVASAWAAPYTATMTADGFDATPDAVSTPNDTGTATNPDLHDAVNVLLGSAYGDNSAIDPLQVTAPDNVWNDLSTTDFSAGYALVGLSAGNTNTLYVYDVTDPGSPVDVFGTGFTGFGLTGDGTISDPFPAAISPFSGGTNFGWRLAASGPYSFDTWDSDPSQNSDELDHMITYHLASLSGKTVYLHYLTGPDEGETLPYTFYDPYLIGWEDLPLDRNGALSDQDYNDMMYIVDRVAPVPEPMTLALMGSGLLGLLGVRRLRRA